MTVNSILISKGGVGVSDNDGALATGGSQNMSKSKNFALPSGTPAEYFTHADVLTKRRLVLQKKAYHDVVKALMGHKREAKAAANPKRAKVVQPKKPSQGEEMPVPAAVAALLSLSLQVEE